MKHIRDPIYSEFVEIDDLALKVISHPYFQRMRRIGHLGLAHYVYPGATHTRFSHMIGAHHLAMKFLRTLRRKGYEIPEDLYNATRMAALLHDVGHTSLSHALEFTLLPFSHEEMGKAIIDVKFREVLGDELTDGVLGVFNGGFEPFTRELVESQMDVDRLDYLRRDAYYCGVNYGLVDVERIVQAVELHRTPQGRTLAVSEKGVFAVESYIIARYLMYWSVYYHKTNLGFQAILFSLFKRVKDLYSNGSLTLPPSLRKIMEAPSPYDVIEEFYDLDDPLIFSLIKEWSGGGDGTLSDLSRRILNRIRFKAVEVEGEFLPLYNRLREICEELGFPHEYYLIERNPKDVAYSPYDPDSSDRIKVIKGGRVYELSSVLPTDTLKSLSREVAKKYLFVPYECWKVFNQTGHRA